MKNNVTSLDVRFASCFTIADVVQKDIVNIVSGVNEFTFKLSYYKYKIHLNHMDLSYEEFYYTVEML